MPVSDRTDLKPCTFIRRVSAEMLAALVVMFLLFAPYISQFLRVGPHMADSLKGRNALWLLWQPHDVYVLLGLLMTCALLATALREVLRRWAPLMLVRLFDHGFVLTAGAGLLTTFWFHTQRPEGYHIGQFGMEMQTAWLLMFAVVGFSLARPNSCLVACARKACLVVSPALAIVIYQLLGLPVLARSMDPLTPTVRPGSVPALAAAQPTPSVYLFIFDEWSYARVYHQGRPKPRFHNLAQLTEQSVTFHNAHSPDPKTVHSIPSILRATEHRSELNWTQPGFTVDGQFRPAAEFPSIFTVAGCADYRKIMVQWGFAVNLWLADELDASRAYSCYPCADNPVVAAGLHLFNSTFYWTDPWSILVHTKLKTRITDAYVLDMHERMRRDIRSAIADQPERTFAIVHYPAPHPPYVLNADGSYRGPDFRNHQTGNVEGYESGLGYVDKLVGEIVADLKAAGRYDSSLLILTSDHSWRQDPDMKGRGDDQVTHVPLLVKLPGQTEPAEIHEYFRTWRLGEFIGKSLRKDARPEVALRSSEPISNPEF